MAPRLVQTGWFEPRAYTSAEYKAWLADQAVAWAKLIKDAGIKLE